MTALRNMSLKTRTAFFITVILLAVVCLSTAVIFRSMAPRLEGSLLKSTSLVGELLVADIEQKLEEGHPMERIEGFSGKLALMANRHEALSYLYIADIGGVILYESGNMPTKADIARKRSVESANFNGRAEYSILESAGSRFHDIALPVFSGSKPAGFVHLGLDSSRLYSLAKGIIPFFLFVVSAGFAAAAFLVTLYVNRFISEPLKNLLRSARKISGGDLTPPDLIDREDEIGQMSREFRITVENISSIINHCLETSRNLEESSVELAGVADFLTDAFGKQTGKLDEVTSTIGEMDRLSRSLSEQAKNLSESAVDSSSSIMENTAAIAEIDSHMSEINASVENITSAILQMSTTVKQVAAGAENTADMAEQTKDVISKIDEGIQNMRQLADKSRGLSENLKTNASEIGYRSVKETMQGILSIQEDVLHAETAMKSLNERVQNIGEIISVIDEITDQTNLLALNASIISAQAGEQGRAFAVVASEIRELSERTSDSTKKISSLIKGVQETAGNYSDYLNRVIKSVTKGLSLGKDAEKALDKIMASASESAEMAGLIAQVTNEQAEASNKVANSVEVFTSSAEEIKQATQEETKGSEFIRNSMEKTKHMIQMVNMATQEQTRGSRRIAETSEKARTISEEFFEATEKERDLAGNIAGSVETLKNISRENYELVSSIKRSSEMMTGLSTSLKAYLKGFKTVQPLGEIRDTAGGDHP